MFTIKPVEQTSKQTDLLYFSKPLVLNHTAVVLEIRPLDNGMFGVVTDSTPFYVKGGGQKSDIGTITCGYRTFEVSDVRNEQGTVLHIGTFTNINFESGDHVEMSVDIFTRHQHTQLHTAGELICAAVKKMGYNWEVVGAIHYPERCSIDYDVLLSNEECSTFQNALQQEVNSMIQMGGLVNIDTYTDPDLVTAACGYFPKYVTEGEPIRVVTVWGGVVGRPCMGTHLPNINQLWPIDIYEVKFKKGITLVKYRLCIS